MIRKLEAKIFKRSVTVSDYGTDVSSWTDKGIISGVIYSFGMSKESIADKIMQDSTHVFISFDIKDLEQGDRLRINEKMYEINYVENPAEMNHHLEIELKLVLEQDEQNDMYIYYGISNEDNIIESDLLNLHSKSIKTKALSDTIDVESGTLHIAYPKTLGKSSIRLRNKLITNWNIEEIMINGVSHYHYSTSVTSGALKIELF